MQHDNRHLYRLSELDDYKVASDDPDVRGWEIVDVNKEKFGTVRELLVDPDIEKVRYLDVEPTRDLVAGGEGKRMLVPIGVAKLDEDHDQVIVDKVDKVSVSSFPLYTGEVVDRDYEVAVTEVFNHPAGPAPETRARGAFYDAPLYDEERFYTNRNRRL